MDLVTDTGFEQALQALPPAPQERAPSFGFDNAGRAFRAGARRTIENDLPVGLSDDWVMAQQYAPVIEALNKVQGRHPRGLLSNGTMIGNPFEMTAQRMPPDYYGTDGTALVPRQSAVDFIWAQVAKERQRNPGLFGQLPQSHQEVLETAQAEQRASIAWSNSLAQSNGFLGGTVPSFAGQAAGGFADPFNVAAMAMGLPASESLLKTALIEGGGNMAVDLAGLPFRAQHYADIGEPMSGGEIAGEVATAGLFGGVFGVGGKLIGRLLGLGGHDLVREFEAQNPEAAPTLRTAAAIVEDRANLDATNPFDATPEGADLHRQSVQTAQMALDARTPEAVPDFTATGDMPRAVTPADLESALADVKARAAAMPSEPSLFQTIRSLGGIKMVDGAGNPLAGAPEIRQIMDTNRSLVNNASGRTPDMMREALAERGWFGGNRDTAQTDVADFLDLIEQEARGGKVYHPESPIHGDLAYRELLDREAAEAGIGAKDKPAAAAQKLADYRASQGQGLADRIEREIDKDLGGLSSGAREALESHGYEPGADFGAEFEEAAGGAGTGAARQAHGQGPGGAAEGGGQAEGGRGVPANRGWLGDALAELEASHGLHTPSHDPESLKRFSDPIRKPKAFREQADDLARELSPPPETPASEAPGVAGEKSPFGDAAPQIEALRRLDGDQSFPDPVTGGPSTVKAARTEIERHARAVERLRGCIEGED